MAIKKIIEIDVEQVKAMGGLDALQQSLQETETKSASLKAELRKLKEQLAQLPEGSAEYNKIAKQAGEVSDKIGDINTRIKNLGSDTKNIDAVVQGTQALSGAFTVATSASALLGEENKDLQETMLKVESAIGLTVGIQSIANALQAESALAIGLNTVATKIQTGAQIIYATVIGTTTGALKALRVALLSTGIGALVVGLGLLIAKLSDSEDNVKGLTQAQKDLNDSLEDTKKATDDAINSLEFYANLDLANAKKRGASEKELLKIKLDSYSAIGDANIKESQEIIDKADKEVGYTKEQVKRLNELRTANNELQRKGRLEIANFEAEQAEKQRDAEAKAGEKSREQRDADTKKIIEDEQARLTKLNSLYDSYLKGNQDLNAVSEQEKLDLQKQRDQEEINNIAKTSNEKANLTALLNEKFVILQQDLDKKLAEEKLKKAQATFEEEDAEFLRLQELTMSKQEYETLVLAQKYEKEYLMAEGNAELQKALQDQLAKDVNAIDEKALKDKQILKEQELALVGQTFGKIAELAGKNSKIGKAFAVGQALMNTYQGITAELQTKAVTPYEIGLKVANVAFVAATGFKAVKQILATNPMSSGGGSASSGGGGASGGGSATPQFNLVGQSSTNQLTSTIAGQQNRPVQTYVVGSQVSTQQALDRNAVANSVFG